MTLTGGKECDRDIDSKEYDKHWQVVRNVTWTLNGKNMTLTGGKECDRDIDSKEYDRHLTDGKECDRDVDRKEYDTDRW